MKRMRGSMRLWSVLLTAVLAGGTASAGVLPSAAEPDAAETESTPSSSAKSPAVKSEDVKEVATTPPALLPTTKSGLPVPGNVRVLVDAQSAAPTGVAARPGVPRTLRVLIFQPEGGRLTWEQLNQLYTERGVLLPSARPVFSMASGRKPRAGGGAAAVSVGVDEETNLYASGIGEVLALGMRRGSPFTGLVVYAVVLGGVSDTTQGALYARQTASRLAASALGLPIRVVPAAVVSLVPAGAAAAGPQSRLQGAALQQLLAGIQQAPQLSPQVRRLAVGLISQANTVTYSTWRTAQPLSTKNFFAFYTQAAIQRTWGLPLTRDETDPVQPTVLFQRPDTRTVVMIRAQPAPPAANGKASTTLFILEMEGNINVGALLGK